VRQKNSIINGLYGGNRDLNVETADTLTAGLVWTPEAITGLSATIDYYDIRLEDTIGESLAREHPPAVCRHRRPPDLWSHPPLFDRLTVAP
jgi:outer membrane receptor protein involved in Fe transport